jgi:hypothetical protein
MGRWRTRRLRKPRRSTVPIIVVTAILLVWHLLRLSVFFSLPLRCLPPYEFWILPIQDNWPLLGSFYVVFALLFFWTLALWFDLRDATKLDRNLVGLSAAVLLLVGVGLWSVLDSIGVVYYQDFGAHSSWNRTERELWDVDECESAKPFLGRWQVASTEIPFLGQEFPYKFVEFRRNLTLSASRGKYREQFEGYWNPPGGWQDYGFLSTDEVDGPWLFELNGNVLRLSTPVEMEEPISRIVLNRL